MLRIPHEHSTLGTRHLTPDTYPTTLVEAETPVRLHSRQSNDTALILLRDVLGAWTVKEVKIDRSTKSPPSQVGRKHESLHRVRVALINTVAESNVIAIGTGVLRSHQSVCTSLLVHLIVSRVQIEGVVAVDVSIDRVASIGRKESRCEVVSQTQPVDPLTHAVEVVLLWQLGDKLDELVLVDQDASSCVVQDITGRLADDGERESGVIAPAELQINVLRLWVRYALPRQFDQIRGQNVLSDVAAVQVCRLDVDIESVGVLHVHGQIEVFNVGTVDIALHLISISSSSSSDPQGRSTRIDRMTQPEKDP
jgi:hypothetical protein